MKLVICIILVLSILFCWAGHIALQEGQDTDQANWEALNEDPGPSGQEWEKVEADQAVARK